MTHLLEHTAVPKTKSSAILFEIIGFEENVQTFRF
jgi:hypothetical protein